MSHTRAIALPSQRTLDGLTAAANALIGTAPAGHPDLLITGIHDLTWHRAADGRSLDATVIVIVEEIEDSDWAALHQEHPAPPAPAPAPATTGEKIVAAAELKAAHREIGRLMTVLKFSRPQAVAFLGKWHAERVSDLDAQSAPRVLAVLQAKAKGVRA